MTDTVLILGASGRFGRASTEAFARAGWRVRTLGRRSVPELVPGNDVHGATIEHHRGEPLDAPTLDAAADGVDVVVHAINPPYGRWCRDAVPLARATARAAGRAGATVLLPGNVYAYGAALPARLDETTPFAPSESLGRTRRDVEAVFREALDVRTIVLRAGDFIEGRRSGNWFEDHIVDRLDAGRVTYPGPLDRAHAWAWLPDMAAAAVGLAAARARLAPFETVGFPGWTLTGEELVAALERIMGRPLAVRSMPWWALRAVAPFSGNVRGVLSMRWLWEREHAIDGRRLAELLPDFRPLEAEAGLALALERLGPPLPGAASTLAATTGSAR